MRVFLCWSLERSRRVAEALVEFLPDVVQAVEPWFSPDIEKGKQWQGELDKGLKDAHVGILCLTPENLTSTWLHFEAGALVKTAEDSRCTYLLGVSRDDVKQPLGQFQHTDATEADTLRLVQGLNVKVGSNGENQLDDDRLKRLFDRAWPRLHAKLREIEADSPDEQNVAREPREILSEMLEILRGSQYQGYLRSIDERLSNPALLLPQAYLEQVVLRPSLRRFRQLQETVEALAFSVRDATECIKEGKPVPDELLVQVEYMATSFETVYEDFSRALEGLTFQSSLD